mmetsp:Transcript_11468/g.39980  ORF Transcript_11468/g.39980 Transcript_11468/m.39980 type:complete len:563 (-) Transcript_11468:240-1928(-)
MAAISTTAAPRAPAASSPAAGDPSVALSAAHGAERTRAEAAADRLRVGSEESVDSATVSASTPTAGASVTEEESRASTEVCGCRYDEDGEDAGECEDCVRARATSDLVDVAHTMDVLAVAHAEGEDGLSPLPEDSDAERGSQKDASDVDVDDPALDGAVATGGAGGAGTGEAAKDASKLAGTGTATTPISVVEADEDEVPPSGFEGPEKVLEVNFVPGVGDPRGCRAIPQETWVKILEHAACSILCSRSNAHFDSYVLSESSLFVYRNKVILKTCGTTTLLLCVPDLLAATEALGQSVEWVSYVRKNFTFPHAQMFPHTSFNDEIRYFQRYFDVGHAYVLGPINSDFWFICVADYCERRSAESTDRTLDIMMFGLDPDVARMFVKDEDFTTAEDVTARSGIKELMPGADIQEFQFDPCGYSMNGLMFEAYFTIHITPEAEFSYASFETNIRQGSYNALVKRVLSIFKPERFTMTMFADQQGREEMRESPFDEAVIMAGAGKAGAAYSRHSVHQAEFEGDFIVQMANYTRKGAVVSKGPDAVELTAAADRQRRRRERLKSWGT